jgi:leucyl/phenylalanyl-tRNA--protein transferase
VRSYGRSGNIVKKNICQGFQLFFKNNHTLQIKKIKIKTIPSDLLLTAYSAGYFPMSDTLYRKIHWYSPDPRAILPLDSFKISRSLKQTIKKNIFDIRFNTAFEKVIRNCSDRNETWISEEIVQSYLELHKLGYALSSVNRCLA